MAKTEFRKRIEEFQSILEGQADLAFLPISADLQYLTGIQREMPTFGAVRHPGGWVEGMWIAPHSEPIMTLTRMTSDFNNPGDVDNVIVLGDWDAPEDLLTKIVRELKIVDVGRIALGERTSGESFINLQKFFTGVKFVSATDLLAPQRMVKTESEITLMKKAGRITESAFEAVLAAMTPGMTELEVILEVDHQLKAHGAFGPSFNTTIYAVGPEHELFFNQHEKSWHRRLEPPVSIMFDFGAIYQGYCYDFGRTVFFGEPAPEMAAVHQLVMASQRAGIAAMQDGRVSAEQVDQAAREVIEKAGMGPAFRHRLGHGIGLDVHEPPFLTKGDHNVLAAGMLFTVEPSIIVPFGPSARVEDVVLVDHNGGVPLTAGFQDLIILE